MQYAKRNGESTLGYLDKIRGAIKDIPGVEISVDQEQMGPPVSKPINIEISGEKFEDLIFASQIVKKQLDSLQIPGVEELKSDLQTNKPEITFILDRERANREGISTGQIGMEIRSAVFGKEVSRYKDENDDYTIRRAAVDHNIPLFTNITKAELFIKAITEKKLNNLPIKAWNEYI